MSRNKREMKQNELGMRTKRARPEAKEEFRNSEMRATSFMRGRQCNLKDLVHQRVIDERTCTIDWHV